VILKDIQRQIEKCQQGPFIYPFYHNYCFSSIPHSILYLFGLQEKSPLSGILNKANVQQTNSLKIVLFLIDGFGYKQWLQYADKYEFLRLFSKKGVVAPLTTIFPSTTAATLATISTGLTPQEHGLPEYRVYFKELDRIIKTLRFSPLEGEGTDRLLEAGVDPKILFNEKTVYEVLSQFKIPSLTFLRESYAKSVYARATNRGSKTVTFINTSDLLVNLRNAIAETPSPAYFFVYWDGIDSIAHSYGLHTEQYLAELNDFFYLLREELLQKLCGKKAEEISLLVTSDHGQIDINPKKTVYLNQYRAVVDNLRIGRSGNKIFPWGSPRDIFLAVKPQKINETLDLLKRILKEEAKVVTTECMLKDGLFGRGALHKEFKSRVGDILILPYGNKTVWFEYFKGKKFKLLAVHGGLTPDEMLIPFAAARGDKLV